MAGFDAESLSLPLNFVAHPSSSGGKDYTWSQFVRGLSIVGDGDFKHMENNPVMVGAQHNFGNFNAKNVNFVLFRTLFPGHSAIIHPMKYLTYLPYMICLYIRVKIEN